MDRSIASDDAASLEALLPGLLATRPGAGRAEDELGAGALPPGEWWVTDPVGGAIDDVHGTAEWCVAATLVRDNVPVLAVVHLPLTGETYTAFQGNGACLNGTRPASSGEVDLRAATPVTPRQAGAAWRG